MDNPNPDVRIPGRSEQSSGGDSTDEKVKRVFRTIQSEFPFLKESKDWLYLHARRWLHIPHESDFKALSLIPPTLEGCYIDVGANYGQTIESILLFKPEAEIVAFEANPGLAGRLSARYKDRRNIRIIAKGLADSTGHMTLFVPSYKGFVYDALSSFNKGSAGYGLNKETILRFNPAKLTLAECDCTVEALDMRHLAPVFMKVDVEGFTYNVLCGGRETLRQFEPILLVENFRGDSRTVQLTEELAYEEYCFDGSSLQRGTGNSGPNSLLMTRGMAKRLLG